MIDATTLLARSQGELYQLQGQYTKAEQYYEQALFHYEAAHKARCNQAIAVYECDTCSVNVVAVESNLAKLYDDMGDYDEAASRYEKVLERIEEIQKRLKNSLDSLVARMLVSILSNLGVLYHHRWYEYSRATDYYNQALDVSRVHLGDQSPATLSIRAHQAQLDLDHASERPIDEGKKARYASDTEAMYLNMVSAYERAVDEGLPYASMQLAAWRNNLAVIYHAHQKLDLARKQYEQARELSMEKGWTSHFSYAVLSTNYAKLIQDQEDRQEDSKDIYKLYKNIEKIYRNKNGEYYKYYQVADFLGDYAQFFLEAKNYRSAIYFLEKAIDIYHCQKPCLGHDKVVDALEAYRKSYPYAPGHQAPAVLYEQLLTAYKQYGARGYAQLANIQSSYASYLSKRNVYLAQQCYEQAFTNYNRALCDYIPDSDVDYVQGLYEKVCWIIPQVPVELVKGRIIQILVKIERALRNYWLLIRDYGVEKEKIKAGGEIKAGEMYEKALVTFERVLVNNHWLLADFYGGYSDYLSKVGDSRAGIRRTQARTIRPLYLASTYQDRKDNRTLAFIS